MDGSASGIQMQPLSHKTDTVSPMHILCFLSVCVFHCHLISLQKNLSAHILSKSRLSAICSSNVLFSFLFLICTITVRIRSRTISTVIKTKTVTDCGCFGNKLISVITKSSLYVSCLLFPCIWKALDCCGCLIIIYDRYFAFSTLRLWSA